MCPRSRPGHTDISRAEELRARMTPIQEAQDISALTSPLDGQELMALLHLPPGRRVGEVKEYLTGEVVEGRLAPDDKAGGGNGWRGGFWRRAETFTGTATACSPVPKHRLLGKVRQ